MRSHTKLHLDAFQSEILISGYQKTGNAPLTNSEKHVVDDGYVVVHSTSYYFANVELFEYSFSKKVKINYSITESSFFMLANLNNTTCFLCYRPEGNYRTIVCDGANTIMLITFKPEWFTYKCGKLPKLEYLVNSFSKQDKKQISLDKVGIARTLFNSFEAFNARVNDLDNDGHIFVNTCINKYYKRIKNKGETGLYHRSKATIISEFVRKNFRTEMVENLPNLANFFAVSERSLARLSKIAFGRPFYQHIIKLRMEYAVDLLLETDKPIKEISVLCGYKEPHHFSKAFKSYIGECPKNIKNAQISRNKLIDAEVSYS